MNFRNYGLAPEIKRLNYFEKQHLRVDDFKDEQKYHLQMRHLHNRGLHTWGIAFGLEVFLVSGSKQKVKIKHGLAIDKDGGEIYVPENGLVVDVNQKAESNPCGSEKKEFFLLISHCQEEMTENNGDICLKTENRIYEFPVAKVREELSPIGHDIPLAKIILENGEISDIDHSIRELFGAGSVESGCVRRTGDTMTGPLIINRAPDSDDEINSIDSIMTNGEINLHLVASTDNEGPKISTNKDIIRLWSITNEDFANLELKDINAHGYISIGVTDQQQKLNIEEGNIAFKYPSNPENERLLYFMKTGAGNNSTGYKFSWRNDDGTNRKSTLVFDRNGDVYFGGGNIGIGTNQPQSKLQIVGGTDVETTKGGYLILGQLTGYNIGIDVNEIMARDSEGASTLHLQHEGGDLIINDTNSEGNVGIGTTSPKGALHIKGLGTNKLDIPLIVENCLAEGQHTRREVWEKVPNNSVIASSPSGNLLFLHWRDPNGNCYWASVQGTKYVF